MCAWDEETVYDDEQAPGPLDDHAEREAGVAKVLLVVGDLRGAEPRRGRSRRVIEGELELRVRVVRQMAERLILSEVKKAFEAEAATLRDMATLI